MKLKDFLSIKPVNEEKFNGYVELDKNTLALITLFQGKKKIKDHRDIHALAEKLGMDEPGQLEEIAYAMLQSFWANGRAMEKGMDFEVDEKELNMGMKVELEHTDSDVIAYRIALDHLAELKDYYTLLAEMEKKGGVDESLLFEHELDLNDEVMYLLQQTQKKNDWVTMDRYSSKYLKSAQSRMVELENKTKKLSPPNNTWIFRIIKETKKYEMVK